ncbi:hypothetical protein LCGC14_1635840 [marine sediment metagenome]|uniref:Portal protein n=1 Tax=marine sediment metagenome TaxID=412755 RepID=A0A0F9KGU7_9ZZZZ
MAESHSTYSFPRLTVPVSEKDEAWHKAFTLAIVNRTLNSNFDIQYAAMNESINFFNGSQKGDEFRFLQTAEDGEVLPAQWINYNRVRNRIEILLGELQKKGYSIDVVSVNKDAKTRKFDSKEQMRVKMRLAPEREALEAENGLPLAPDGFIPKDEAELDDFFKYGFKEKNEIIMEHALRYITKLHNWKYQRLACFRDIMIQGAGWVKCEVQNGLPYMRRIDPRFMVFDTNATDDFLSDSTYFGEVRYMTIGDAAAKYGLTREELLETHRSYQEYLNSTQSGAPGNAEFRTLSGTTLSFFNTDGADLRVLVLSAVWLDYKKIKHKRSIDSHGNEHIKRVKDTAQKGDLKVNNVAIWRQATLVGGKILKEWGEMENQVRDNDSLAETKCPYKAVLPHYLNGQAVSKVDQLKGLQKLKNITMYNIQLAMARAGAKGFIYDVSQVPDGWDIHNVIKYLKTAGIAFIDSKKEGIPSTHNQFNTIDMTLSDSVKQYLAINDMIDSEMDSISGINDARRGEVQGASQAVGVTRSALSQSNLATEVYFDLFNQFNTHVLNYLAGLIKITFAGNERYAPIIGDAGINFLKETVDMELDDFAVFAEEIPPIAEDFQNFQALVQAALQARAIDFVDATKLMLEKDILIGIERYERAISKRQEEQQAVEQAAMQEQLQAQQVEQQGTVQLEIGKIDKKGGYDLQKQQLQNKGDMDEIMAEGRVDIGLGKIDFAQKMAIEKIKARAQDRKAEGQSNKK